MSQISNLLKPSGLVRGMQRFDKSLFEKEITVPYVSIKDVTFSSVIPILRKYFMKICNFKPVQNVDSACVVYLHPCIIGKWDDINDEDRIILKSFNITGDQLYFKKITLKYDNFNVDDILKSVLPVEIDGISSYTQIGHIVHVNLKEHLLPYKEVIGQILLDKIHNCRTVVNKASIIDNTYRNFKMELLCGDANMMTTVKQNRCRFEFDFSKVYWNSRLSTEHERIVKLLRPGDVLFDVFAGVGPFSIPSAKKKCHVYANDLNPESYKWLKHNAELNNVNPEYFCAFNKDGMDFIKQDLRQNLLKHINKRDVYVTMNLPALACDFLKYFVGLYDERELDSITNPPTMCVYCFAKGEDFESITRNLINESLGRDMSSKIKLFPVRTVSNFKEMMRVIFKLDEELLIKKTHIMKRKGEGDTYVVKKS